MRRRLSFQRSALGLAIASIFTVMAACGGDNSTTSSATTAAAPATTSAGGATTAGSTTSAPPKALGKATMLVGGGAAPVAALAPQSSLPQALGYWKAQGLDVTVQTGISGDAQAVQLIDAGQGTTAVVAPSSLMAARAKGLDLVGAYVYIRSALNGIYVKDDSPIQTIAQLNGKTIGTYAAAGGPFEEGKFIISQNGGDPNSVKIVNIGFDQSTVKQIQDGAVDAYIVTEPDFFSAQGLKLRKLPDTTENQRFGFLYAFKRDYIQKNPDAVVAMLRGIAEATQYALANPAAAIKLHWQVYPATKPTGQDDATALQGALLSVSGRYAKYQVPAGQQYGILPNMSQRWDVMVKLAQDAGTITAPVAFSDAFTDQFIAKVNDFDAAGIAAAAKAQG
jgi:NitT/TauT family transport system substrate-binding protein